jgi:hypothetical protein
MPELKGGKDVQIWNETPRKQIKHLVQLSTSLQVAVVLIQK